jgi:hypothetical protein
VGRYHHRRGSLANPDCTEPTELTALLKPYPAELMEEWLVVEWQANVGRQGLPDQCHDLVAGVRGWIPFESKRLVGATLRRGSVMPDVRAWAASRRRWSRTAR